MPRKVYWDSCTFLGLLNVEPGKVSECREVWQEAENNQATIYTSFLTFAEVFRAKCEGKTKPLLESEDARIESLLRQAWIVPVVVDEQIGLQARRLMRRHPECKKPNDGIHLATALRLNVDEMHTFDGSDLLHLDNQVYRLDGKPLRICKPLRAPPEPNVISAPKPPDLWGN